VTGNEEGEDEVTSLALSRSGKERNQRWEKNWMTTLEKEDSAEEENGVNKLLRDWDPRHTLEKPTQTRGCKERVEEGERSR